MIYARAVFPSDYEVLACRLAPLDREELSASHPGEKIETLLLQFVEQSAESFTLVYKNIPVAMGGITSQGCIWMLTGTSLQQCKKSFVCEARKYLAAKIAHYKILFNWVDENHVPARRFIGFLGGHFNGQFQWVGGRKFLFFTFRRDSPWVELFNRAVAILLRHCRHCASVKKQIVILRKRLTKQRKNFNNCS